MIIVEQLILITSSKANRIYVSLFKKTCGQILTETAWLRVSSLYCSFSVTGEYWEHGVKYWL